MFFPQVRSKNKATEKNYFTQRKKFSHNFLTSQLRAEDKNLEISKCFNLKIEKKNDSSPKSDVLNIDWPKWYSWPKNQWKHFVITSQSCCKVCLSDYILDTTCTYVRISSISDQRSHPGFAGVSLFRIIAPAGDRIRRWPNLYEAINNISIHFTEERICRGM